jgi:hypothetical protein
VVLVNRSITAQSSATLDAVTRLQHLVIPGTPCTGQTVPSLISCSLRHFICHYNHYLQSNRKAAKNMLSLNTQWTV